MDVRTFGLMVFLALIKSSENIPFELSPHELTAKEGTCAEIKCKLLRTLNDGDVSWFWMKDGKWNTSATDFTGTIVYSTKNSKNPVSPDFVDRVKYIGSSSLTQLGQLCSILICNLKKNDGGVYAFRYVGRNPGQKWMTNKNVILKVEENPCRLTFKKPPPLTAPGSISLTCSTSNSCSSEPQIQDLTQIPPTPFLESPKGDKKSTTVRLNVSWEDDGKVFSCQTLDNTDFYFIQNISLAFEYAPKEILAQGSKTVNEGGSVTLTCSAKGNPQPEISWFNGETLQSLEAKWTITPIEDSQSGEYYCEAQNSRGTVRSQPVVINVTYKPEVEIKALSPLSDIREGDTVILKCVVKRSKPKARGISWFGIEKYLGSGENYTLSRIGTAASGSYTCEATNSVGTGKSTPYRITVQYRPRKPSIHITPSRVKVGSTVAFECKTNAVPSPHSYSWYRYNTKNTMIGSSRWKTSTSQSRQNLDGVQRADEGCYTCNATNRIGTGDDSEPVCIEVLFSPTEPSLSMVSEITEGRSISIFCTVESNPPSTFTIRRTSDLPPKSLEITQEYIYLSPNKIQFNFNVTSQHAGFYTCKAANSEGSNESQRRKLAVKYTPKQVKVHAWPGLVVRENSSFTLDCSSESNPSVTQVTWRKTVDGKNTFLKNSKSLTIRSASLSDSGQYSCEAINEIGTGRSMPAVVNVMYAPKRTTIERSTEKWHRDGRSSVTLSCSSHSYPVSQYFWYRIRDTEDDELMSRLQHYTVYSNQPGGYYCVAKNTINQKSSDPVYLFQRNLMMILRIVFICLSILFMIILFAVIFYKRRKKSNHQGSRNTQPLSSFLVCCKETRRGNLNEMILAEPFRSRDDLLPDRPCRPKPQRRQPCPDSTPASNINTVYSTVKLPTGNQAPATHTKPDGGPTGEDSVNYASLHFGNVPKNQQVKTGEDVYAKVSKPNPQKKDYENINPTQANKPPQPVSNDSDTSENEDEVTYSQVKVATKSGHQEDSTDSSTSDDDEIQYSDVKF